MTIKKRIFLSNILMLVLPVIMSIFTTTFLMTVSMKVMGLRSPHEVRKDNDYQKLVLEVLEHIEVWKKKWLLISNQ